MSVRDTCGKKKMSWSVHRTGYELWNTVVTRTMITAFLVLQVVIRPATYSGCPGVSLPR